MKRRSILSRQDYTDYLLRLVFGDDEDLLEAAVKRAYRDICRSLHGLTKVADHERLVADASRYLRQRLLDIASGYVVIESVEHFDGWHRTTCERIDDIFALGGYPDATVGQVQRWVNTTFSYVHTIGNQHLPGFDALYPWCHVRSIQPSSSSSNRWAFHRYRNPGHASTTMPSISSGRFGFASTCSLRRWTSPFT